MPVDPLIAAYLAQQGIPASAWASVPIDQQAAISAALYQNAQQGYVPPPAPPLSPVTPPAAPPVTPPAAPPALPPVTPPATPPGQFGGLGQPPFAPTAGNTWSQVNIPGQPPGQWVQVPIGTTGTTGLPGTPGPTPPGTVDPGYQNYLNMVYGGFGAGGQPTLSAQQLQAQIQQFQQQLAMLQSQFAQQFGLQQQQFGLQQQQAAAGATGMWDGNPTLAKLAQDFAQKVQTGQIMGSPKNIGQSLSMLGLNQQQGTAFLNQTPLVQMLQAPYGQNAQPQNMMESVLQAGQPPSTDQLLTGLNAGPASPFAFIQGHQAPVKDTMNAIAANSPLVDLYSGLAEYSGQTPEAWWGDWQASLPKGGLAQAGSFF